MRHLFRLNLARDGYVLYAGDTRQGFRPQPLDLESPEVPAGYLRAQRRLDEVFAARQAAWTVAMQRVAGSARPLVAYGSWLPVADKHGRVGIGFVHAVELDEAADLYPCVAAVLHQLSAVTARRLVQELASLAAGKPGLEVQEFLHQTAAGLEKQTRKLRGAGVAPLPPPELAVIEHDCAGAGPVAWLTMAALHARAVPPWQVFDQVGSNGLTRTHAEPSRGRPVAASQLLLQLPREGLNGGVPEPVPVRVLPPEKEPLPSRTTRLGESVRRFREMASLLGILAALTLLPCTGIAVLWAVRADQARERAEAEIGERDGRLDDLQQVLKEEHRKADDQKRLLAQKEQQLTALRQEQKKTQAASQTQLATVQALKTEKERLRQTEDNLKKEVARLREDQKKLESKLKAREKEVVALPPRQQNPVGTQENNLKEIMRLREDQKKLESNLQAREKEVAQLRHQQDLLVKSQENLMGSQEDLIRRYLQKVVPLEVSADDVSSVAFSPDGKRLAATSETGTAHVWEKRGAEWVPVAQVGEMTEILGAAFSPDGSHLALAGSQTDARTKALSGVVKLWNVGTKEESVLPADTKEVWSVAFSPDGHRLATGGKEGLVKVWDLAKRQFLFSLQGHRDTIRSLAFDQNGKLLASGSRDGSIRLWDVEGRKPLHVLDLPNSRVNRVVFSPEGKYLAAAVTLLDAQKNASGGAVKVWEKTTWKEVFAEKRQTGPVWGVAYSNDGKLLASAGGDGTVRLWDAASGQQLLPLPGFAATVWSVAFSPDGQHLATGSTKGHVRVWGAP